MKDRDTVFKDDLGYLRIPWVIAIITVGVCLFCAAIALPIRQVSHHYDKDRCRSYAKETERVTKFVDYHFWGWDCLTKTSDGLWVSTDNAFQVTK